jgi:hypothetical protein
MRGTGIDSDVEIYATKQSGRWIKSETPVILFIRPVSVGSGLKST